MAFIIQPLVSNNSSRGLCFVWDQVAPSGNICNSDLDTSHLPQKLNWPWPDCPKVFLWVFCFLIFYHIYEIGRTKRMKGHSYWTYIEPKITQNLKWKYDIVCESCFAGKAPWCWKRCLVTKRIHSGKGQRLKRRVKKAARVFHWENMDPGKTETSSRNSVSGNFAQLEGGQHTKWEEHREKN